MGDLTKNISRHELACKCGCGLDSLDWETIEIVQRCCDHFAEQLGVDKVLLRITSAARCHKHNLAIGSTKSSQHPKGRAIDFTIDGVSPSDVHEYLVSKYPGKYGIGRYDTFTHLDTRTNGPARW